MVNDTLEEVMKMDSEVGCAATASTASLCPEHSNRNRHTHTATGFTSVCIQNFFLNYTRHNNPIAHKELGYDIIKKS